MQGANAIVDAMSAKIMKKHGSGLTDPQLRQLIAAHIDDDSFCRYIIQQDLVGRGKEVAEKDCGEVGFACSWNRRKTDYGQTVHKGKKH